MSIYELVKNEFNLLNDRIAELESQLAHKEELRQEALGCLKNATSRADKLEALNRNLQESLDGANLDIEALQAQLAEFTTLPSNVYAPDNVSWQTHCEELEGELGAYRQDGGEAVESVLAEAGVIAILRRNKELEAQLAEANEWRTLHEKIITEARILIEELIAEMKNTVTTKYHDDLMHDWQVAVVDLEKRLAAVSRYEILDWGIAEAIKGEIPAVYLNLPEVSIRIRKAGQPLTKDIDNML